jgi:hypothetical protein
VTANDGTRAALREADEVLQRLSPPTASPALALMRASMEGVRDDLAAQLDAHLRTRVEVTLDGAPVSGGRIRVDALTRVLHALQEAVSAIGQALTGKATSSSSIPGPLRSRTALSFATTFQGSFGAVLEGPAVDDSELQLFDPHGPEVRDTLLDESLGRVLRIIQLAGENPVDDGPVVREVLPLGSRAFKHLRALSNSIVDEDMTASLNWRASSGAEAAAELTASGARRLGDILGRNRVTEEQVVETGLLGTVSNIRNRIELDTGANVIAARVIEELVPRLGEFFSQRVVATLDVSIARSLATGGETRAYTLVDLRESDDEVASDS